MPNLFDPTTLGALRTRREVGIRASRPRGKTVIIWVVVVGEAAFVRSVRGPRGLWFTSAAADGAAALELDGGRIEVRASMVTDPATIEAVSQEFLRKYAGSPWAASIVAADTLPTTLRLDPV